MSYKSYALMFIVMMFFIMGVVASSMMSVNIEVFRLMFALNIAEKINKTDEKHKNNYAYTVVSGLNGDAPRLLACNYFLCTDNEYNIKNPEEVSQTTPQIKSEDESSVKPYIGIPEYLKTKKLNSVNLPEGKYIYVYDYATQDNIYQLRKSYDELISNIDRRSYNLSESARISEMPEVKVEQLISSSTLPTIYNTTSLDTMEQLHIYNLIYLGGYMRGIYTLEEYKKISDEILQKTNELMQEALTLENFIYRTMMDVNVACDSGFLANCSVNVFINGNAKKTLEKFNDNMSFWVDRKAIVEFEIINRNVMIDYFKKFEAPGSDREHPYYKKYFDEKLSDLRRDLETPIKYARSGTW